MIRKGLERKMRYKAQENYTMRRANKSGSIYKLSGKRHKPWAVKVTTGRDENGVFQRKYIGYYETKREAIQALDAYLIDPRQQDMTIREAWEGWMDMNPIKKNTFNAYRCAYRRMDKYYNLNCKDITLELMEKICYAEPVSRNSVNNSKAVLNGILEYAFAHDACPASRKELLKYIKLPERPRVRSSEEKRFTDDEIQSAIDNSCTMAIILIFTGIRLAELLSLKEEDIDLDKQSITIRESKTYNGIRTVPIPDKLIPYWERWMEGGYMGHSECWVVKNCWNPYKEFLGSHGRHDCRHTYVSLLTEKGVDQRMVQTIVGHSSNVTTDVYTHFKFEDMLSEVNRVLNPFLPEFVDSEPSYNGMLSA